MTERKAIKEKTEVMTVITVELTAFSSSFEGRKGEGRLYSHLDPVRCEGQMQLTVPSMVETHLPPFRHRFKHMFGLWHSRPAHSKGQMHLRWYCCLNWTALQIPPFWHLISESQGFLAMATSQRRPVKAIVQLHISRESKTLQWPPLRHFRPELQESFSHRRPEVPGGQSHLQW